MKTSNTKQGTRQRLIAEMADLLQRKGYHGFGLNEILSQAQASEGCSLLSFPKGKTELAIEAIKSAVMKGHYCRLEFPATPNHRKKRLSCFCISFRQKWAAV
jgi:hypothetical protein